MSTLPPGAPPPPPPPPESVNPLPWEDRERRGLLQSFVDTMGLFISRPAEAWARTRASGDLASPLFFGTIITWFSLVAHRLIMRIAPWPMMLPGAWARRMGEMGYVGHGRLIFEAIFAPIGIVIGLFIVAAVLHVCCLLVGALTASTSGFEGTYRAVAYSQVASLPTIIPGVGHLISMVWWVVLAVMGIQRLHRTSQGKAIAAVLIPVVICCGAIVLLGMLVGAAILSRMGH